MKLAKYKYQYERYKAYIDDLNSIDGSIDVHEELEALTKETDLKYLHKRRYSNVSRGYSRSVINLGR